MQSWSWSACNEYAAGGGESMRTGGHPPIGRNQRRLPAPRGQVPRGDGSGHILIGPFKSI
jgi:hypothetical protein